MRFSVEDLEEGREREKKDRWREIRKHVFKKTLFIYTVDVIEATSPKGRVCLLNNTCNDCYIFITKVRWSPAVSI